MSTGLIFGCLVPHPPILIPDVAGRRAAQVRQTREAVKRLAREIRKLSPDSLVLISPHAPLCPRSMGISKAKQYQGSFEAFGAPSATLQIAGDPELAETIESKCASLDVPVSIIGQDDRAYTLDHGATVPLHFLLEAGICAKLVLATFSALDVDTHLRLGKAIAAAAGESGKRVVLIASGDLSHRLTPNAPAGYSLKGREFDQALVTSIRTNDRKTLLTMDDRLLQEAGECGYRSLVVALGAMPESTMEVLSYEGPFGVGYLVASLSLPRAAESENITPEHEKDPGRLRDEGAILTLAQRAVETYVREGRVLEPPVDPEGLLAEPAGAFVSLKVHGALRGCIGTFEPTEPNIAAEIIRNGIAAATRDPRFLPVRSEELPHLKYSVDILSPPELISGDQQLDPKKYGVIVQSGGRRGLLLPDLEGVDTVEDQISIARRKAGIPIEAPVQLHRFTVQRFGG